MRYLTVALCVTVASISAQTDLHAFDCRKKTNNCQNGGTCETTGVCTCPGTKQNYDCSDDLSTDEDSNICGCVTGTCKNNGLCVCPETHYGVKCDQNTIQATCSINGKIVININIPNITNIEVYRAGRRSGCSFTTVPGSDVPSEWAGKSRAISLPSDVMCGDAVPKRVNGNLVGYCVDLIIRHDSAYLTNLDSRITFCCMDSLVTKSIGNVGPRETTTTAATTTTTPVRSLSILHQASCTSVVLGVLLVFML